MENKLLKRENIPSDDSEIEFIKNLKSQLEKYIKQYKNKLKKNELKYLIYLFELKISALDIDEYKKLGCDNFICTEIKEMYQSFIVYNLYNKLCDWFSHILVSQEIIKNENYNNLSFGVMYNGVIYNVCSLDFTDIPSVCLYKKYSIYDSINSNQTASSVMNVREEILNTVLSSNNLTMSDFADMSDSNGCYKIKKYPNNYANITIK